MVFRGFSYGFPMVFLLTFPKREPPTPDQMAFQGLAKCARAGGQILRRRDPALPWVFPMFNDEMGTKKKHETMEDVI